MKKYKPMSEYLIFSLLGIVIIISTCYAMYIENNRVAVNATVSKLARQADSKTKPTTFSAESVLENRCPDIAVKLAKQGYILSTDEKTLVSFVDKAMACHDNHVITVKSK